MLPVLFSIFILFLSSFFAEDNKTFKIGVVIPLTGAVCVFRSSDQISQFYPQTKQAKLQMNTFGTDFF